MVLHARLLTRAAVLLGGVLAGLGAAVALGRGPLTDLVEQIDSVGWSQTPFEVALEGLTALALVGCVGWLAATTLLTVLVTVVSEISAASDSRLERLARVFAGRVDRVSPAVVRGLVTLGLGVTVVSGVSAPALADVAGRAPTARDLIGLPVPDRTTDTVTPVPTAASASGRSSGSWSVVRPGDSLWSIAAELLPHDATDARTSRVVHRIYAANRSRIGEDPDLLRPGTRLVLPHPGATDREDHR